MELRLGKYFVDRRISWREERGPQYLSGRISKKSWREKRGLQLGFFAWAAIWFSTIGLYAAQCFVVVLSPFLSLMKRMGQRWGTYFGIKSMVSNALGDDLAFERVMKVRKISDVVPTTMITMSESLEAAILAKTVSGTDELVLRIYRSLSNSSAELEFGTMAGAVSEVLRAKQLVHSQYYEDESIICAVARAIAGEPQLTIEAPSRLIS
jgi:hypothetical protein